eukprot:5881200-Amphidinium_carterae.1
MTQRRRLRTCGLVIGGSSCGHVINEAACGDLARRIMWYLGVPSLQGAQSPAYALRTHTPRSVERKVQMQTRISVTDLGQAELV